MKAYITFEYEAGRDQALRACEGSFFKKQEHGTILGEVPKFIQASEPADIKWDHL